jgi:hypothetical protein
MRHYLRRPGRPGIALPGEPDSAEFRQAYRAALAGSPPPRLMRPNRAAATALRTLIEAFDDEGLEGVLTQRDLRLRRAAENVLRELEKILEEGRVDQLA